MSTILDYMRNTGKTSPGTDKQTTSDPDPPGDKKILKPQLDSNMGKQIMLNMESVMKSLKRRNKYKKHRQKKASKNSQQVEDPKEVVNNGVVTTEINCVSSEEEDESLASLKKTWLSARPKRKSDPKTKTPTALDPDKKDAFQMMMLNGSKGSLVSPNAPTNDENQVKDKSPEIGKRKLSSVHKEQAKRRKIKAVDTQVPVEQGVLWY